MGLVNPLRDLDRDILDALTGTFGDPSDTNKFVTDLDPRINGALSDSDFPGSEGILRKVSANNYTLIKTNLNALGLPSVNDDTTQGYSVGSLWKYENNVWICTDNTANNAIWKLITTPNLIEFDEISGDSTLSTTNTNYVDISGLTYTLSEGVWIVCFNAAVTIRNPGKIYFRLTKNDIAIDYSERILGAISASSFSRLKSLDNVITLNKSIICNNNDQIKVQWKIENLSNGSSVGYLYSRSLILQKVK